METQRLFKYFRDIEAQFKTLKYVLVVFAVFMAAVCIGVVYVSVDNTRKVSDRVYVVDNGFTISASAEDEEDVRDAQARVFLDRFHSYMFSLAPNVDALSRNFEKVQQMGDGSIRYYWNQRGETNYYDNLVAGGVSQELITDSIRVDMNRYPYDAAVYGRVFFVRKNDIILYNLETSCQLRKVPAGRSNPYGLYIENFIVRRNELIGKRAR